MSLSSSQLKDLCIRAKHNEMILCYYPSYSNWCNRIRMHYPNGGLNFGYVRDKIREVAGNLGYQIDRAECEEAASNLLRSLGILP